MKRLLAYLFVILGLGLTFNVSAKELQICSGGWGKDYAGIEISQKKFKKDALCEVIKQSEDAYLYSQIISSLKKNKFKSSSYKIKYDKLKRIRKSAHKKRAANNELRLSNNSEFFWGGKTLSNEQWCAKAISIQGSLEYKKKCFQFAKAEPSQTQKGLDLLKQQVVWTVWVKHADKDYKSQRPYTGRSDYVIYDIEKSKYLINPKSPKEEAIFIAKDKCRKDNPNNPDGCLIDKINELTRKPKKLSSNDRPTETKSYYKQELKNYLAKAEPSQTQEVAEKINNQDYLCIFRNNTSTNTPQNEIDIYEWGTKPGEYIIKFVLKNKIFNKDCLYKVYKIKNKDIYQELVSKSSKRNFWTKDNKSFYRSEHAQWKAIDEFSFNKIFNSQTQIAKAEPTIIPKKKVKVAKVEEPKQEEFKPKKTNQDNEAPVITIAEAITVDSQAYTLKGKVKDKSQVYLTIDGRQVDVKKGKFKLDRFNIDPDVAENIKIVAIDKWNNRTEKTIKVTIDLQSTDVAKVYEQLKPNNIKVKTDKNKIAIIIGIEKYENLTNLDAKYANRDAKAFRTYATRALGIKPSNIKVLIDDKANRGNTLEAFKIWLPKIAGKGGKDIHIFFAGHGLASENGKDLYILPQDGNAKLLDDTAITRVELITLIQKVNPKSVTMFFDTCYSGQTRDERMLVASLLRPIQIISEEQDTPDNFTIFSASNYDQVSGGIEEAQHGMFSYYLMKGLEGNADENKDKKITNGELIAYLKDNVSEEAFTQNREQDPMLAGDPDKVLMSYR